MRYTVSVLVENRAGVLPRISGLSGRQAFSIESFAAGVTGGDRAVSRMAMAADCGP